MREFNRGQILSTSMEISSEWESERGALIPRENIRKEERDYSKDLKTFLISCPETLQTLSWITIFSIFGTLTRVSLTLLSYQGVVIPPLVWAQFVGCLVIGFMTEDKTIFRKNENGQYYNSPLFLGITSGYCGSTTSFSSWLLEVYFELSNSFPSYRYRYLKRMRMRIKNKE